MNATTYAACKDDVRRDEGFRSKPYKDTRGVLTIGYGRNLDHVGISRMEAEELLDNDIVGAIGALTSKLPWFTALDPVRQRVLVNMTVQLGIGGVLGFRKMLDACRTRDYELAAIEMLDSKWATQTPHRAERLARWMRTGAI